MSRGFDENSPLSTILANAEAREVLEQNVPGLSNSPMVHFLAGMPVGRVIGRDATLMADDVRREALWRSLADITDDSPPRDEIEIPEPRSDYEPAEAPLSSASWHVNGVAQANDLLEVVFDGPSHGNPFIEVDLQVTFTAANGSEVVVGGAYDGDGKYLVRLLPEKQGLWAFRTESNARSLDGIKGEIEVKDSNCQGAVRVADTFHFRHQDGTRHTPIGTTVYAWVHQPEDLQNETLRSLIESPFNKLRFCLFPKSYLYNVEEPSRFPFPRNENGTFDLLRFDVEFFKRLDARMSQLLAAGIQADFILFHPYDRWGFANLGQSLDDHVIRYVVRRYAGYPNVWWSLANEYDLMWSKSVDDWERIADVVVRNDHARHLTGIHNCFDFYDHSRPWITHSSLQRVDVYRTAENTDAWREEWGKPAVIDECGYEGDLDQGWGNLTGEEMTRRFWEGAVRGGYVQHGETYYSDDELIWWSKGGTLRGTSVERIRFLADIIAEAPGGVLDPLPSEWDAPWGGVADEYMIIYFGFSRPGFRTVSATPGKRFHVDVIDTWEMTIERLEGTFEGTFTVRLPARQYMALRLVAA